MNSKTLILLRHGKSDWSIECSDFERPLKKRGKLGALRIGHYLKEINIQPSLILSSPAERAKNTAEKCVKAMGYAANTIVFNAELYETDFLTILKILKSQSDNHSTILLVGHNPGLEDLLVYLAGDSVSAGEDGKILTTATIARMELNVDSWQAITEKCANLQEITRAKNLSALFPSFDNNVHALRERPDYYYQQSAAIPYRVNSSGIEILLIGASSKSHWTIPKGIVEPGLSAAESATKEAFEEAGIQGFTHANSVGQIQIKKWGGTCNVEIFLLRVDQEIHEDDWQEQRRGRQWFSLSEAARTVQNKEIAQIISSLEHHLNNV